MNEEKQRIAIAEALGWKRHQTKFGYEWEQPDGKRGWQQSENEDEGDWIVFPPDYLNDLNAMHEAEKVLTRGQWPEYKHELWRMFTDSPQYIEKKTETLYGDDMLHATATQRAESMLRVLGKWEE